MNLRENGTQLGDNKTEFNQEVTKMVIKGLDKSYLEKTGMTAEEIIEEIMDEYLDNETIKTISIESSGWDAYFGNYAVIKTAKNRHWVVANNEVTPYDGWAKERGLL